MIDKLRYWLQWFPIIGYFLAPYEHYNGRKNVINDHYWLSVIVVAVGTSLLILFIATSVFSLTYHVEGKKYNTVRLLSKKVSGQKKIDLRNSMTREIKDYCKTNNLKLKSIGNLYVIEGKKSNYFNLPKMYQYTLPFWIERKNKKAHDDTYLFIRKC